MDLSTFDSNAGTADLRVVLRVLQFPAVMLLVLAAEDRA